MSATNMKNNHHFTSEQDCSLWTTCSQNILKLTLLWEHKQMNFKNLHAYNVGTVDGRASSGINKYHKPWSIHGHNPDKCKRTGYFLQTYAAC
jgi:hypothetical protein